MATLFRRLAGQGVAERGGTTLPISFQQWVDMFSFGGNQYPFVVNNGNTPQGNQEPGGNFQGYVDGVYKRNGVVFSCIAARLLLFSEARFQFQRLRGGRPGDLYGTTALNILEHPWEKATTDTLLVRAEQDVSLAGNFYAARRGNNIRRLRPDWMTIVLGSRTGSQIDVEVVGYLYHEGGQANDPDGTPLLPEHVCHFAPYPDPDAHYRGMSWLQAAIGDIIGDQAASEHKSNFFSSGATLGYVVTVDPNNEWNQERLNRWKDKFRVGHEGPENAYKTLFLTGGADVKIVGTNLKDLDFKSIQGAGETRICAAARVPPIIAGFSEGLESATYSNYGQARRAFGDLTMRPMWRMMANALSTLVEVPADSRLWYDDRDIPFLQEDEKDDAEIQSLQASTIRTLVDAGFTWESAVSAVVNSNMSLLEHTGLYSVQLQAPGSGTAPVDPAGGQASQNGNGQPALPAPTS